MVILLQIVINKGMGMRYLFLILIFATGCGGSSYTFWSPTEWAEISVEEAQSVCDYHANIVTGGALSINFKRNRIFNSCMRSKGFKMVTVK